MAIAADGSVWTSGISYSSGGGVARVEDGVCEELFPLGEGKGDEVIAVAARLPARWPSTSSSPGWWSGRRRARAGVAGRPMDRAARWQGRHRQLAHARLYALTAPCGQSSATRSTGMPAGVGRTSRRRGRRRRSRWPGTEPSGTCGPTGPSTACGPATSTSCRSSSTTAQPDRLRRLLGRCRPDRRGRAVVRRAGQRPGPGRVAPDPERLDRPVCRRGPAGEHGLPARDRPPCPTGGSRSRRRAGCGSAGRASGPAP